MKSLAKSPFGPLIEFQQADHMAGPLKRQEKRDPSGHPTRLAHGRAGRAIPRIRVSRRDRGKPVRFSGFKTEGPGLGMCGKPNSVGRGSGGERR